MKKKFGLIILITLLVSGVITMLSFVAFDLPNLRRVKWTGDIDDYFWIEYRDDDKSKFAANFDYWFYGQRYGLKDRMKLEGLQKIELDTLHINLSLERGPNQIELYSKREQNLDSYQVSFADGVLKFSGQSPDPRAEIVIRLEDWSDVELDISKLEGALNIEVEPQSLEVDQLNGVLHIDSDRPFDLDLAEVKGVVNIEYDGRADLELKIDELNSLAYIFGRPLVRDGQAYSQVLGSGKYKLNFGKVSGVVKIDQD